MSADVWIESPPCATCGRSDERDDAALNVTYNLSPMLYEAGFVGWRMLAEMSANAAGAHILGVLNGMAYEHQKWRAKNPENGWGDYDKCLQGRMRAWAERCMEAAPNARIGASL